MFQGDPLAWLAQEEEREARVRAAVRRAMVAEQSAHGPFSSEVRRLSHILT